MIKTLIAFSRGWFIAPVATVAPQEIRNALARLFCFPAGPDVNVLGRGLPFAFGRSGHLDEDMGITPDEAEALEKLFDTPGALFHLLGGADNAYIEPTRSRILRHAEEAARGQEKARAVLGQFPEAERKRAYAAKLTLALEDDLKDALHETRRTMGEFLALGGDALMTFWASVPTAHVEIELTTARDKQSPRRIPGNDAADVDSLSVAIPYSDLVLTEAFWGQLISQAGLAAEYGTIVGKGLGDLPPFLEQLRPSAATE